MNISKFAERFREARENSGMTLKQLKEQTGISISALSHYANGNTIPPLEVAIKIANAFDVSLDWLCGKEINSIESFLDFKSCADVAICLDMILERFKDASIKCETDIIGGPYIELTLFSEALYNYYRQIESTHNYYKSLPTELQEGFKPYKKAMEKKLQNDLRTTSQRKGFVEEGYRLVHVDDDELPF